ncbi:MerR family transcriptional regulator [Isoptericola aurantiacus]|uniref:MerR family transcriptional regulator n=1 Tax=Isoptericola aurantiacus TaxID=3377839 RepID=UPI00383AA89D
MTDENSELLIPAVSAEVPPEGLTIGEAAVAVGLSVDTLRYYERAGLLLGPVPRDGVGRRRYGRHDLAWLSGLVMLRATGMAIADVRVIADLSRRPGTERQRLLVLEEHRDRVLADLARTRRHLAALDAKISTYRDVTGAAGATNETDHPDGDDDR